MSFITKRERVFNEYVDPFDLPPRNEGKLKAYSSCTDTRAWSHFSSDQSEHLVELIKRNNEACRAKYVPVNVIVEMMMGAKNAEIARLKRQVGQLEEMLAVFDDLELSCEQKCEIAAAHAMIKAANKSLDELALDLDVSNFTEGIDSEGFQTGKSGGDEGSGKGDEWDILKKKASKTNQAGFSCHCDASTSAHDIRIDELQEALINKDAKLNAMQNTIAVMENDVCEPYCVYAHIYTALEKIFATLRQNDKYRLFLDLMSSGKDTRCIDIKGKILFKLKILEKFGIALLAPCSERFKHDDTCECYSAQVMHVETTYALTSAESRKPGPDTKRAQLVADIMQNDEMKEILVKESFSSNVDREQPNELFGIDNYSIDNENLNRLKNLQLNYDDLMTCYENVKHERDSLKIKCHKYDELEQELANLRGQLREYNALYNERDYYRRRSEDLDGLKEQYLVLSDETSNLETQLKAEAEINSIKSDTIEDLRIENIALEKKLNDSIISFEKEKNVLQCKLKETECKVMCQDQQIRSLSYQIDRILEQDHEKQQDVPNHAMLMDEIEALKEQIKNLKETLYSSEEEKQQLQTQFEDNLKLISNLKLEIEDWKSSYEKTLQRNEYLEKYTDRLEDENRNLSAESEEKSAAVENLLNVIHNKSQEVNKLMEEIEHKKSENKELHKKIQETREKYGSSVMELENERKQVLDSLHLARRESQELLEKVKDYDELLHKKEDISKTLETQREDYDAMKSILLNTIDENKRLQQNLDSQENNNAILLQEIQRLRDINKYAVDNISSLQDEKQQYQLSLELTRKDSEVLEDKLKQFEDLREQMQKLRLSHEKLSEEKNRIENELHNKSRDLDEAIYSVQLSKKESEHLQEKVQQSEIIKGEIIKLNQDFEELANEKQKLEKDIQKKNKELDKLLEQIKNLTAENEALLQKSKIAESLESEQSKLKKAYDELSNEKSMLQADFDNKTDEINNLYNTLEGKIEENRDLLDQIKVLEHHRIEAKNNIEILQDVNMNARSTLDSVRRESEELINKLKNYESLLKDFEVLKADKERLEHKVGRQSLELKRIADENEELGRHAETIMAQNEKLEQALANARSELVQSTKEGPLADVMKEITEMKTEKIANHKKIRELLDKLDERENMISDLNEDLMARDDKIAILQNHINSLEDEVRSLHKNLEQVVTTGEEIKDTSYQKIDETLNIMEAHHSKATHNMKMELARLHNENAKLEEQLSVTKIRSEESFRDRHKYVSQIIHLQNEREVIVTDIKQLELSSVGDSNLTPVDCSVEDILKSLDRIRKCLEAKHSKSNTLEQTLLKVQTSSQLLLSKADEAKRLVEKEKQKIIFEKEEAISDRLNMERQLMDLKFQLEEQNNNDKAIIKELEAEMLNQELIIRKFKESTEDYITKLKDEMQSLQNLYQNSIATVNDLQQKIKNLSEENDKNKDLIKKITAELEEKAKEVSYLQKYLHSINKKSSNEVGVQIGESYSIKSVDVQVEKTDFRKNSKTQTDLLTNEKIMDKDIDEFELTEINILKVNKPTQNKLASDHVPIDLPEGINEVQILTANVDNSLEFVKSSYVDYKIKRLGPGKLEQYSISCISAIVDPNDSMVTEDSAFTPMASTSQNVNFIDLYNRPSARTTSSKAIAATDDEILSTTEKSGQSPQNVKVSSGITGLDLVHDISNSSNLASSPEKSQEKDLFLIYQDSESSQTDKMADERDWMSVRQPTILAEALTLKPDKKARFITTNEPAPKKPPMKKESIFSETKQVKQHIQIDMPRIKDDSLNSRDTLSLSESEKKLSYASPILSPESKNILPDLEESTQELPHTNSTSQINVESKQVPLTVESADQSHHKLSRVDADFLLFKDRNITLENTDHKEPTTQKQQPVSGKIHEVGDFGLEYILDTVNRELNPNEVKDEKKLRKSRSDVIYYQMKGKHSAMKLSPDLPSSEYNKTNTNSCHSPSKWSEPSQPKSVTEQSVSADIDVTFHYEDKIKKLTEMLENTERDYKRKLDAIKVQYDSNIKSIINEHNQGVKSIQSLHEETLQDIIKIHENEVENLRTMSIEAMRKAERLEKENRLLKGKVKECGCSGGLSDEPVKISTIELKKRKSKCRGDTRMLTKTNVEAFNVKPKLRVQGPCTCSLDVNVSDTIRNIFEQVDVEQRKMAEHAYLKYIANKILTGSVEALDAQELSFLHLKVCRTWKTKLSKEEALQKRIDTLENELVNKQRNAQQHIAELDRKVAEERRRLQEVREAVCRSTPERSSPDGSRGCTAVSRGSGSPPPPPPPTAATELTLGACSCTSGTAIEVAERRSAGDLVPGASGTEVKFRRTKKPESRAVLVKLDVEERREKRLYDEHPTRLRRPHDRPTARSRK